jgi:hypothetical protein
MQHRTVTDVRAAENIVGDAGPFRLLPRSDDDIRSEIVRELLLCGLWRDPACIQVHVRLGIVRLPGRVETKTLIPVCMRPVSSVEGAIDVVNELSYDFDDTRPAASVRR